MVVVQQVASPVRKSNALFAPTAEAKCSTFRNYFANNFARFTTSPAPKTRMVSSADVMFSTKAFASSKLSQ